MNKIKSVFKDLQNFILNKTNELEESIENLEDKDEGVEFEDIFILTTRSLELDKSYDLNKFNYEAYKLQPCFFYNDQDSYSFKYEQEPIGIKIIVKNFRKVIDYLNSWKRLTSNLHLYQSTIKMTKISDNTYEKTKFKINEITPYYPIDIIETLHKTSLFLHMDNLNQVDLFKNYEDLLKHKLCEFGMAEKWSNILINEINRKYSAVDNQYTYILENVKNFSDLNENVNSIDMIKFLLHE